jgi:4-amino-4-deoxy-L-arabinose transferase-like glycosyltransferase
MPLRVQRLAPWAVAAIAIAAGILYLVAIREGAVHGYYSPASAGMAFNWHNFIFGSADTAGFAGVDKIPGSLWPQALSVSIFGYSTWALLIPEVLASVATIVVLYLAVARWLGKMTGVIAALMYACTPVVAAVAQVNVPEAWFALPLTIAAYFTIRAVQSGKLWWLIGSGLAIAAAFQVKMLQAWLLWPAVIVVYLIAAPATPWKRIWQLLLAGAVSLFASLSWVILVWLTPAASRPWVGGSDSNSPWEMVFGYNGLGRFGWWSGRTFVADFAGSSGLGRLVGPILAVDLGWLLPIAVVSLVAGIIIAGHRARTDITRAGWIFFGLWCVITGATLVWAGGIHTFYVVAYAPALAALAAGGVKIGYDSIRNSPTRWAWLSGVFLILQIVWTVWLITRTGEYIWLIPLALGFAIISLVAIVWHRADLAIAAALVAMLAAPLTWSISTLGNTNNINPTASHGGKTEPGGRGMPDRGMPDGGNSEFLISWLKSHDPGMKFLVAGTSDAASGLVIAEVRGVMYLGGGFHDADPTPTAEQLANLVSSGQLAYVLQANGRFGPGGGPGGPQQSGVAPAVSKERAAWITQHCTQVVGAPPGLLTCK